MTLLTTRRRWMQIVGALASIVAALTVALTPATAHTALLDASPAPDAAVGGTVDFVHLEFLEPVSEATVTVLFNGEPLSGVTTVGNGTVIQFELDQPLAEPGRYELTYEMISFDTDFTTTGYFFTYDPAAAAPTRIEVPTGADFEVEVATKETSFPIIPTIGFAALLVAVLAAFVWSRGRSEPVSR